MGSALIGAWVAHIAFWILLAQGLLSGELSTRGCAGFVVAWLAALVGLPFVPYAPAHAMFPSVVAILDIALVFVVFKGDVRIA
ncbi:MAG TPA: hypothetical protein VHU82_03625 [Vicinamibacterales bacterium]|jgi:hypothetical protein|nr:hypothetical protein [Vicinamibacterales bacterium]